MKKLSVLSLAALVCACTGQGGSDEAPCELAWGTDSVHVERPIAPGEALCYQVNIKLDTLQGESPLAQQVNAMLRGDVLGTWRPSVHHALQAFADSIDATWKQDLAEFYDADDEYKDMYQYNLDVTGSAMDATTEGVLSYETRTDSYQGGAHGSYDIRYYNFDKKSGRQIAIDDVVPADKREALLEQMKQKLCADNGVSSITELQEQTCITMLGDLYLTDNFLLKGDSIMFVFGQYEVAPYSVGIVLVTVPRP